MLKKILFWVLAIIITLGASVYQRLTGPTNPKYLRESIDGKEYVLKFPRSGGTVDCPILLEGFGVSGDSSLSAAIYWRKYPTNEEFSKIEMQNTPDGLFAELPTQPMAGKLEYYIAINTKKVSENEINTNTLFYFKDEPLIIRFKGDVPAWLLIPHILFMFISMLFAAYALLAALSNMQSYKKYITVSFWLLIIGGLIAGPLVQKYAFGALWTGFPFGADLTDNKTLIAAIFMLLAVITKRFSWNRIVAIIAVLVMFIIFSIPHSMNGSELDHATGEIKTSSEF